MGSDKMKKKRSRRIKPFEELTITDDFMFGAVMSDPKRCKRLLEYILGIKIIKLEYVEKQKTINIDYDAKSIRLDVTVIDDKGIVYNIEMQTSANENLPLRIRYYHDVLDLELLHRSMDYNKLNRCFVIFICNFDMFGKNRYMYTFKRQCQEDPAIFLGDESVSVVLNTKGCIGEIDPELKEALKYMDGQTPAGKFAKDLDAAVNAVKTDKKWRLDYMTYELKMREYAIAAKREGEIIGELKDKVSAIRVFRNNLNSDQLMAGFHIDKPTLDSILDMIDNYPDWTDEDIAYELSDTVNDE